jgi:hypothetical protein
VRGPFLFLWGQSENISFSVKDEMRFIGAFSLSVMLLCPLLSPQTVNQSDSA